MQPFKNYSGDWHELTKSMLTTFTSVTASTNFLGSEMSLHLIVHLSPLNLVHCSYHFIFYECMNPCSGDIVGLQIEI